jgi:hypothetical protein
MHNIPFLQQEERAARAALAAAHVRRVSADAFDDSRHHRLIAHAVQRSDAQARVLMC